MRSIVLSVEPVSSTTAPSTWSIKVFMQRSMRDASSLTMACQYSFTASSWGKGYAVSTSLSNADLQAPGDAATVPHSAHNARIGGRRNKEPVAPRYANRARIASEASRASIAGSRARTSRATWETASRASVAGGSGGAGRAGLPRHEGIGLRAADARGTRWAGHSGGGARWPGRTIRASPTGGASAARSEEGGPLRAGRAGVAGCPRGTARSAGGTHLSSGTHDIAGVDDVDHSLENRAFEIVVIVVRLGPRRGDALAGIVDHNAPLLAGGDRQHAAVIPHRIHDVGISGGRNEDETWAGIAGGTGVASVASIPGRASHGSTSGASRARSGTRIPGRASHAGAGGTRRAGRTSNAVVKASRTLRALRPCRTSST